jgi:hypothetical protein
MLAQYTSKWVALKDGRVVASGDTLRAVKETVEKKKMRDYAFHFVERYPLAM